MAQAGPRSEKVLRYSDGQASRLTIPAGTWIAGYSCDYGGKREVTEWAHAIADLIARWLELAGVAIIILGVALAAAAFLWRGLRTGGWLEAYQGFRSNLVAASSWGSNCSSAPTLSPPSPPRLRSRASGS